MCNDGTHDGPTQSDRDRSGSPSARAARSVRDGTRRDAGADGGSDQPGQMPTVHAKLSGAIRRLIAIWGHMLGSADREEIDAIIKELNQVKYEFRSLWMK